MKPCCIRIILVVIHRSGNHLEALMLSAKLISSPNLILPLFSFNEKQLNRQIEVALGNIFSNFQGTYS